jgi:hypothetical protein
MTTIGSAGLGSLAAPTASRLLPGHQVFGTNRGPLLLDLPGQAWFDVQLMHTYEGCVTRP